MATLKINCHSDKNGDLHLVIPAGIPLCELEVQVSWNKPEKTKKNLSRFFGILRDNPLERPDQGNLELRDPID